MSKSWVVLFDDQGLDTIIPWTDLKEENIMSKLAGEVPFYKTQHIISRTILRAQLNSHRNTEVWGFNTAEDMSVEDMLRAWKTEDITPLMELVRSKGDKLY
jgi:hypothetical protein